MNKSEAIVNLAKALSQAQGEMPVIKFNSINPFLKNNYADLGAIIAGTRPVLAKFGLAVTQLTFGEDGVVGVETMLTHSSGEWISDRVSMQVGEERGKSSAQVAGSIVTYLRRYSLASILGVYADEDGDGQERPKAKPLPRDEVRVEPEPITEAKPEFNPDSVYETMTIERACKVETSKGVQYGTMPIAGLEKMLDAMWKQVRSNGLTAEATAEIEHKIKAAQMVLAAKKSGEIN